MSRTKAVAPASFAVAEHDDPTLYADGIDMLFDYSVYNNGLVQAWRAGTKTDLAAAVASELAARPVGGLGGIFLGNHDVPGAYIAPYGRVADLLAGDVVRLQTAALLLFSLPATPFVYYGEEIGLYGAPPPGGGNAWSRNPMQWSSAGGRGFTTGSLFRRDGTLVVSVAQEGLVRQRRKQ